MYRIYKMEIVYVEYIKWKTICCQNGSRINEV